MVSVMRNISGNPLGNLPAGAGSAESEAASMVARARLMMFVAAFTTLIAIVAVVTVIGYRVFTAGGGAIGSDGIITLPPGARVVSTSASGGRVAVLIDIGGASELRTFDIRTLKQTGRLRFATEP
jgi:hypothetical protein